MESEKVIIKFNSGNLAILCSHCSRIIKTGKDFTKEEIDYVTGNSDEILPPQFCEFCKEDGYENTDL